MEVNLGGIVPLSTVDWPGRAAMVVFLRGCPLRCPHCHNRKLQTGEHNIAFNIIASRIVSQVKGEPFSEEALAPHSFQINLDEAEQRVGAKPFVDAIVLCGGEPLYQPEACARLFRLAKSLHLATGLETSACYPKRLEKLLEMDLVDKVFLDIKTALIEPDYERATGISLVSARVRESLEICFRKGVALDARTTIFPEMPSQSQLVEIAGTLTRLRQEYPQNHLESLVLQQGQARDGEVKFGPVSIKTLQEMAESIDMPVKVLIRVASKSWIGEKM